MGQTKTYGYHPGQHIPPRLSGNDLRRKEKAKQFGETGGLHVARRQRPINVECEQVLPKDIIMLLLAAGCLAPLIAFHYAAYQSTGADAAIGAQPTGSHSTAVATPPPLRIFDKQNHSDNINFQNFTQSGAAVQNQTCQINAAVATITTNSSQTATTVQQAESRRTRVLRNPMLAKNQYKYAESLTALGQIEDAAMHYAKAVALNPTNTNYADALRDSVSKTPGLVTRVLNSVKGAFRAVDTVVDQMIPTKFPSVAAESDKDQIDALFHQKNFGAVIQKAQDVLESDPQNTAWLTIIAEAYLEMDQPKNAMTYIQQIRHLEPNNGYAMVLSASAYEQQGNLGYASNLAELAVKAAPEHAIVLGIAGQIFIKNQDFSKAKLYLGKAVKVNPENAANWHNLATMLFHQKEYKAALKSVEEAVKREPENTMFQKQYVLAFSEHTFPDNWEQTQQMFDDLLEQRPEDHNLHNMYARMLFRWHQSDTGPSDALETAEASIQEAIELDGKNAAYHNNLAYIAIAQNNMGKASTSSINASMYAKKHQEVLKTLLIGNIHDHNLSIAHAMLVKLAKLSALSDPEPHLYIQSNAAPHIEKAITMMRDKDQNIQLQALPLLITQILGADGARNAYQIEIAQQQTVDIPSLKSALDDAGKQFGKLDAFHQYGEKVLSKSAIADRKAELAFLEQQSGNAVLAKAWCDQVLQTNPRHQAALRLQKEISSADQISYYARKMQSAQKIKFQHAQLLFSQGKFEDSLQETESLLGQDQHHPAYLRLQAENLRATHRYSAAIDSMVKIRVPRPEHYRDTESFVNQCRNELLTQIKESGVLYNYFQSDQEHKLVPIKSVSAIDSEVPQLVPHTSTLIEYIKLMFRYKTSPEMDIGNEALNLANEIASDNPEIHQLFGTYYLSKGDFFSAQTSFEKAYSLNPDQVAGFVELGNYFSKQKDFKSALIYYQKALSRAPHNSEFLAAFIKSQYNQYEVVKANAPDAAKQLLDSMLVQAKLSVQLSPSDPVCHNNYALFFNLAHQPAQALKHIKKAVDLGPYYIESIEAYVKLLVELDRFNDAKPHLDAIIDNYLKDSNYIFALEVLVKILKYIPNDIELAAKITKIKAHAYSFYKEKVQEQDTAEMHYKFARVQPADELNVAITHLKRAIELDPNAIKYRRFLVDVYIRDDQLDEAIDLLKSLLSESTLTDDQRSELTELLTNIQNEYDDVFLEAKPYLSSLGILSLLGLGYLGCKYLLKSKRREGHTQLEREASIQQALDQHFMELLHLNGSIDHIDGSDVSQYRLDIPAEGTTVLPLPSSGEISDQQRSDINTINNGYITIPNTKLRELFDDVGLEVSYVSLICTLATHDENQHLNELTTIPTIKSFEDDDRRKKVIMEGIGRVTTKKTGLKFIEKPHVFLKFDTSDPAGATLALPFSATPTIRLSKKFMATMTKKMILQSNEYAQVKTRMDSVPKCTEAIKHALPCEGVSITPTVNPKDNQVTFAIEFPEQEGLTLADISGFEYPFNTCRIKTTELKRILPTFLKHLMPNGLIGDPTEDSCVVAMDAVTYRESRTQDIEVLKHMLAEAIKESPEYIAFEQEQAHEAAAKQAQRDEEKAEREERRRQRAAGPQPKPETPRAQAIRLKLEAKQIARAEKQAAKTQKKTPEQIAADEHRLTQFRAQEAERIAALEQAQARKQTELAAATKRQQQLEAMAMSRSAAHSMLGSVGRKDDGAGAGGAGAGPGWPRAAQASRGVGSVKFEPPTYDQCTASIEDTLRDLQNILGMDKMNGIESFTRLKANESKFFALRVRHQLHYLLSRLCLSLSVDVIPSFGHICDARAARRLRNDLVHWSEQYPFERLLQMAKEFSVIDIASRRPLATRVSPKGAGAGMQLTQINPSTYYANRDVGNQSLSHYQQTIKDCISTISILMCTDNPQKDFRKDQFQFEQYSELLQAITSNLIIIVDAYRSVKSKSKVKNLITRETFERIVSYRNEVAHELVDEDRVATAQQISINLDVFNAAELFRIVRALLAE